MPDLKTLIMALRGRQPRAVKQAGRALAGMVKGWRYSAVLDDALLSDCRVVQDRQALIDRLPKGGVVAEVGVETGGFSAHILASARPAELHLIDLTFAATRQDVLAHPAARRHEGRSDAILAGFPDAHFDWIYIDGDHSHAGVAADLAVASRKVKPGGYLVFNDFAMIDAEFGRYGVHNVVSDFAAANRWPLRFLALAPNTLYDVAIERPA
jgi:SAM-dependent methyltransferase